MIKIWQYSEAAADHNNEDSIAIAYHPMDRNVHLCALADGQGGQIGGGLAAQIAVNVAIDAAKNCVLSQLDQMQSWLQIFQAADQAVYQHPDAGYTTLICLAIIDDQKLICGAACGDSAALLINGQQHQTLTARQRKNPPVGCSKAIESYFEAQYQRDFQLLMLSDGVWKYAGWSAILQLAQQYRGQQLIDQIRQRVLSTQGNQLPDDFSIVLANNV